MTTGQTAGSANACVEHGIWTPVPRPPPAHPDGLRLHYAAVDAADHDSIVAAGRMTVHLVGCTGDFVDHQPQEAVADGMAAQVAGPAAGGNGGSGAAPASFLYHLGDVIYKPGAGSGVESDDDPEDALLAPDEDRGRMYNDQFYAPYSRYGRPIFAIAGNHDGKFSPHYAKSAVDHFFTNFCATASAPSPDNATDARPAMTQPYIYWRLDTPLAHFLGLYANIANGGILDDPSGPQPGPQSQWLAAELRDIGSKNAGDGPRKAIILAVHYPPYSGATNFRQRGDPTLGPTNAVNARPLGAVLQQAFRESGQRPDVVVSAHAHLYERLTYRYGDGWELPLLIAGSGGHAPVEQLFRTCDGAVEAAAPVPFDAVLPAGLALPLGDSVQVVAYDGRSFGFLRLTVEPGRLTGEFFTATSQAVACTDSFVLDTGAHQLTRP